MEAVVVDEKSTPPSTRRIRRSVGVVLASVCTVALLAGCISKNQQTVQNQINATRASHSLSALADYSPADAKAQAWAEHLAEQGSLSHSTLSNGYESGTWCRLAENVGMGPTLDSVNAAFINSPPHLANILGNFDHVGTGVVRKGDYVYVVHEFVDVC